MTKYVDPKTKKKDAFFSGRSLTDIQRRANIRRLTDKSTITEGEARTIRKAVGSTSRPKKRRESRY